MEIIIFILLPLHAQEFIHGEYGGCAIVLIPYFFDDVVLLCLGIVFDGAFDITGIAKVERIAIGVSVGITAAVIKRVMQAINTLTFCLEASK